MTLVKMVRPGITLECNELDVPFYVRAGYKRASGEKPEDKIVALQAGIVEPTDAEKKVLADARKKAEAEALAETEKPLTAAEKKAAAKAHVFEPELEVPTEAERKAMAEGHTLGEKEPK